VNSRCPEEAGEKASVSADPGVDSVAQEGSAGQIQDGKDASKGQQPERSRCGGAAVIFDASGRNEMGCALDVGLVELDQKSGIVNFGKGKQLKAPSRPALDEEGHRRAEAAGVVVDEDGSRRADGGAGWWRGSHRGNGTTPTGCLSAVGGGASPPPRMRRREGGAR
jgi:hypothetical protein